MDRHFSLLQKRISQLEFSNDQLATEIEYVDKLLKLIGFSNGLQTVKEAAQEIWEEQEKKRQDDNYDLF